MRSTRGGGGGGGEMVQVQGGHIVRATGRKDRHSKVYTARGPRDRRVRLSAHTAIQFYDVQDRLGYDRPSKAVDWLIMKAKSAIDKLAESQSFEPTRGISTEINVHHHQEQEHESSDYNFQINRQLGGGADDNSSQQRDFLDSFVAPLMDLHTDNSTMNFQNYPHNIISRTANPEEDLGLSLHPFQGKISRAASNDQTFLSGSAQISFDAHFHRFSGWNSEITSENRGFMVHSQPSTTLLNQQATILGQEQSQALLLSQQRGTLQSSFPQSFRSWGDHLSVDPSLDHHDKTRE